LGYQEIRVYFKIDADVSGEQKEDMVRMAQEYSPVFKTITKSAPVSVHFDKEMSKPKSGGLRRAASAVAQT
jgi:uncharacterized OsmC-like protein